MSTLIEQQMIKRGMSGQAAAYYLEIISQKLQRVWFAPSNKENHLFDVCRHLSELNLVASCRIPRNDGAILIYFMWADDCNYNDYFII